MLNIKYIYYILIVSCFACNACEYQLDDISETILEKPSEIPPQIEFNVTPNTDTLKLEEPITLNFLLNVSPRKINQIKLSLDGEIIYLQDNYPNGSLRVDFDPRPYEEGIHVMEIFIFINSASGSIADKISSEGYFYQLKWPVLIDKTPPSAIPIRDIELTPQGALISWNKFAHPSFKEYRLQKISRFENVETTATIIKDKDITEYLDTTYLQGEKVYYQLFLNSTNGPGKEFSTKPNTIYATSSEKFNIELKWEAPENIDRLDYYYIFKNDLINPQSVSRIPTSSNQYLKINNVPFGEDIIYNLMYIPKTNSNNVSKYGLEMSSTSFAIGNSIPQHEITKGVHGSMQTLMSIGNKLILYDHKKQLAIDSINFGNKEFKAYRLSPNGEFFISIVDQKLQVWSLPKFNFLGEIDLNQIGVDLTQVQEITVSSNFRILFNIANNTIMVYDFATKSILIEPTLEIGWAKISPDGNQIVSRITQDHLSIHFYTIENNSLKLIDNSEFPVKNYATTFFFSSVEFNQLIICIDKTVEIRCALDFSLINQFETSDGGFLHYDAETNQLITAHDILQTTKGYISQLPDGIPIKEIQLKKSSFILYNNYLIGENGRQLNIKD